jgi:hypothetical protein
MAIHCLQGLNDGIEYFRIMLVIMDHAVNQFERRQPENTALDVSCVGKQRL